MCEKAIEKIRTLNLEKDDVLLVFLKSVNAKDAEKIREDFTKYFSSEKILVLNSDTVSVQIVKQVTNA